jgi:hypothetical protein
MIQPNQQQVQRPPGGPKDYVGRCEICQQPIYGASWHVLVQSAVRHGATMHSGKAIR